MRSFGYYSPPHQHQQHTFSHLPVAPNYLGTPPSQSAALTSYNPYQAPSSPHHSPAVDYWYQYPTYGSYPPTPTSPYSAYSSSSSHSPHFSFPSPVSPSSTPRGLLPEVPDYLQSREPRNALVRNPLPLRQRVRKRRASTGAIADLKLVRIKDLPEDERCCNICMEPYVEERYPCDQPKKENAMKMPCGHVFGSYCLKHWLQSNNTCPACRVEVEYVEIEEEAPVPRSRTQRRASMSTHELIVNDLFGEPYRDPTPLTREKPPHTPNRSRSYYGNYELEPRPGTAGPCPGKSRPTLRRSHTSMGQGGPVRYPFARPPSEDYGRYGQPSPPRHQGLREQHHGRPGSSASAATTQSEPTRSSGGYYTNPGLPSTRPSNSRGAPFRSTSSVCGLESLGLCMLDEDQLGNTRLVRLECGHGYHPDCIWASMKAKGDKQDMGSRQLWCERCRKYLARKSAE